MLLVPLILHETQVETVTPEAACFWHLGTTSGYLTAGHVAVRAAAQSAQGFSQSRAGQRMAIYQNGDGGDEEAQILWGKGPVPALPFYHKLLPGKLGGKGPKG